MSRLLGKRKKRFEIIWRRRERPTVSLKDGNKEELA